MAGATFFCPISGSHKKIYPDARAILERERSRIEKEIKALIDEKRAKEEIIDALSRQKESIEGMLFK